MTTALGIPKGASLAIDDMLDNCARIQAGQEVLILAYIDGLFGGDNLVDQQAIAWLQNAIRHRDANVSVLWVDEPDRPHAWRIPPIVKAAMKSCDVLINNSFDLEFEEIVDLKNYITNSNLIYVRNFATTAPLLNTAWAQTPYELVSEIRYQAAVPFKEGVSWKLTDNNGTHLEGIIGASQRIRYPNYTTRRSEKGGYRPWPEWVIPPISIKNTSGVVIFDRMYPWWSRYIGIPSVFEKPISLTIENNRVIEISGGDEADALRRFLNNMIRYLGEGVYDFNDIHCGVHPQAVVGFHQCSSPIYRRVIEHGHACNIHFHIGAPQPTKDYPYWMHCTGDIRKATWLVGDTLLYDNGHLTVLDHPDVLAIAAKYPKRPGIAPELPNY